MNPMAGCILLFFLILPTTAEEDTTADPSVVYEIFGHMRTLKVGKFKKYYKAVRSNNEKAADFYNTVYQLAHMDLHPGDVKDLGITLPKLLKEKLATIWGALDLATRDYIEKNWRKDMHKD
ncbi:hypothetical protein GCK32_005308 [Trichostrongylus colubriformis]|uniref:Uncharacterized protein n=1 Tax=Trichostrongylus colubriformis TaxID=6319 RepID=A0AAN8GBG0_TRICO